MTTDTRALIDALNELDKATRRVGLSVPGEPAWPIEQDRIASVNRQLDARLRNEALPALAKLQARIEALEAENARLREALIRAESDFHLIALDSGIRLTLQQNAKLARDNCRAALKGTTDVD